MATRQPVGEVLNGLTLIPLDPGTIALECIVLVKTLDEDGDPSWSLRHSETISTVEIIGALDVMHNHQRVLFENSWVADGDSA